MKKILYIIIALSFFACKNEKKTATPEPTSETTATTEQTDSIPSEDEEELPILTGVQTRKAISEAPYDTWFAPNYSTYVVDTETLEKIIPLFKGVSVKIFMGTWCSDSQREVPHFYKILDAMNVYEKNASVNNYELITVDEDKVTPEHLEDGFDITNVPTFIFYRDGKEINRIVEAPIVSLEKDMLSILSGEDYKHTYKE